MYLWGCFWRLGCRFGSGLGYERSLLDCFLRHWIGVWAHNFHTKLIITDWLLWDSLKWSSKTERHMVVPCRNQTLFYHICDLTHWAKTRHIPHFMKIEIRLEISRWKYNCVAVKKWKWSVAWFPSYGVKGTPNVEHNFSRKHNFFTLLLQIIMSLCTIVLHKIDVFLQKNNNLVLQT